MCSEEAADAHRFMDLVDAAIAANEAPSYAKYKAWAKKVAARPRPTAGAAGKAKGKGGKAKRQQQDAEAALVAQIRGRQERALALPAGGMLSRLLAEVENSMPSEEEFQAAQKRLQQKQGGSKQKAAASGGGKRTKKT